MNQQIVGGKNGRRKSEQERTREKFENEHILETKGHTPAFNDSGNDNSWSVFNFTYVIMIRRDWSYETTRFASKELKFHSRSPAISISCVKIEILARKKRGGGEATRKKYVGGFYQSGQIRTLIKTDQKKSSSDKTMIKNICMLWQHTNISMLVRRVLLM